MSDVLMRRLSQTPALYTIPADTPFIPYLAKTIFSAYGDCLEDLSDLTVLLPSDRAARAVSAAFFQCAQQAGLDSVIMPTMRAIGSLSADDIAFLPNVSESVLSLPPIYSAQSRRGVLKSLVQRLRPNATSATALGIADDLAQLLDLFTLEGVSFDKLDDLVPPDVLESSATHWQDALKFFNIIRTAWPAFLSEVGAIDRADHQHAVITAFAEAIESGAIQGPIIVAGSMGTVPAIRRVISAVARSPKGGVILPGFDPGLDEKAWQSIGAGHPQFRLKALLDQGFPEVDRTTIAQWSMADAPDASQGASARLALWQLALRPTQATDDWYAYLSEMSEESLADGLKGVSLAIADTENEEADFVAIAIREALDDLQSTVMLVTPDRNLARRVTAKLEAWGIRVNDTGGIPLYGTYRGTFLRLIAEWLDEPHDAARLLAMLSHPLAALGVPPSEWAPFLRRLDLALRGPQVAESFADVLRRVEAAGVVPPDSVNVFALLADAVKAHQAVASVKQALAGHVQFAEALAQTEAQPGPDRLWQYEDGEALADHLAPHLRDDIWETTPLTERYAPLFAALLQGAVARKQGGHPRLSVLGLLEARLQSADFVILGGLTEGQWPSLSGMSGFLSRPMLEALGLPSPEHLIGDAAHDFMMAASQPKVLLTRSKRKGKDPSVPSRWMIRMESLLEARKMMAGMNISSRLRHLSVQRSHSAAVTPADPPRPSPPLEARPRILGAGDIEKLVRDPYAIYAKKILRLRKHDPVGTPVGIREQGSFFHTVMEVLAASEVDGRDPDVAAALNQCFEEAVQRLELSRIQRLDWTDRFIQFNAFAQEFLTDSRRHGRVAAVEVEGVWPVPGITDFSIRGRVDRMDRLNDGRIWVYDFKSGEKSPSPKQSKIFSPQLNIMALMAESGAFAPSVERGSEVFGVGYLKMSVTGTGAGMQDQKHSCSGDDLKELLALNQREIVEVTTYFEREDAVYLSQPRAEFKDVYGDYDHLARRKEWQQSAGEDSDD